MPASKGAIVAMVLDLHQEVAAAFQVPTRPALYSVSRHYAYAGHQRHQQVEHQAGATGKADLRLVAVTQLPTHGRHETRGEAVHVKWHLVFPRIDIPINQAGRPFAGQFFITPKLRVNLSPQVDIDARLAKRVESLLKP